MKFNLIKLFQKQKWALVKTYTIDIIDDNGVTIVGSNYIRCFESNKSNRKVEFTTTFGYSSSTIRTVSEKTKIYQNKVYPWLHGRNDLDIPRYSDVTM